MSFEKWYKTIKNNHGYFTGFPATYMNSRDGWDACKKEVLKILNSRKVPTMISEDDFADVYLDKDKLKELIKKL